jgi:hypothetical protein
MPIYKNKGDPGNPDSYRGITLVSSVGKFFTSILNSRLTKYADLVDKIPNAQARFRKGYSTTDTIFCLHVLIDIYIYIYMSFGKNYIAHLLTLKTRLIQFGGWGYGKNW